MNGLNWYSEEQCGRIDDKQVRTLEVNEITLLPMYCNVSVHGPTVIVFMDNLKALEYINQNQRKEYEKDIMIRRYFCGVSFEMGRDNVLMFSVS